MTLKEEADYKNLVERYKAFPEFASNIIQTLQTAVEQNMTNHIKSMKGVVETYQKIQDNPAEESAFMEPFKAAASEEVKAEALKAVTEKVVPGFKSIQDCLVKTYMPNLRKDIAATSLPNGVAYYNQCLKFHTS